MAKGSDYDAVAYEPMPREGFDAGDEGPLVGNHDPGFLFDDQADGAHSTQLTYIAPSVKKPVYALGITLLFLLVAVVLTVILQPTFLYGETCVTPFGTIIGVHNGVFAYSNCRRDHISTQKNSIKGEGSMETGMEWQCFEYVKRYWIMRGVPQPVILPTARKSSELWSFTQATFKNGSKVQLERHDNGGSQPLVGDLLVYREQPALLPVGHVAVIVRVGKTHVWVAEQNWFNKQWHPPFHNFSRTIKMHHNAESQTYELEDMAGTTIKGWMRYKT
ncbi:glutathionylspermidine synthetase, putative [Trypanosoma brucei gambiense DAL972]|uniref:Glutathionylspermidine synthetase, putative n=2 Tax=Trypanosoma brucei TaxID=5691 RepID=D0A867_TRYB9|nr:glutathionylspermidine synthetase, putative [Trypanosoma brucei gambiense DAL972]RHW67988.1 glutathionylspermidine synthetase [Trypanosoma brucei equiperdum]CBH17868.1 glutathionylspermidine synthetase, putative [Trypanosoma brucei gambiense DAL972]|eukprot:XP_011780132.1 glutathionylspermidine synthetase, putative [Trypanosoma brucei gambiense DAL972]